MYSCIHPIPSSVLPKMNRIFPDFSRRESLVGKLIVASPEVPTGSRSYQNVVLILQDQDDGVFGVSVNCPASQEVQTAWQQFSGPSFSAEHLADGGPVSGPVLALHRNRDLAEMEIEAGLYVSVQKESLERLSELEDCEKDLPLRVVLGAVNWNVGVLEKEIADGKWYVIEGNPELIFGESDRVWFDGLRLHGRKILTNVTGISSFPECPLQN